MESSIIWSPPLQQLKSEHVLLQADMDLFYDITEEIEFNTGATAIQLFIKLHQQIAAFTDKLKAHSKREEECLFPMMSRHLGENNKTIEVMEFEHEKAEQHLHDFLSEGEKEGLTLDESVVQWITVYAVQAYATLTQHFAKEEKMLFPLAENILSADEKEELIRLFQTR